MSGEGETVGSSSNTDFSKKIVNNLVQPTYYSEIKYNLDGVLKWEIISNVSDTLSNIFMGVTVILSFAAGSLNNSLLSFLAGCSGTISLVLARFSAYALKESKTRTEQSNLLLKNLNINPIVDITVDSNNGNDTQNETNTNLLNDKKYPQH